MQITKITIGLLTVDRPKDKDPWRLSQLTRSLLQCYCNVIRQTASQVLVGVSWTSWGWWYEWGDTALQTHDLKLSPVGLRPSTLSLGHVGCPQYSIFTIEQGGNILFFKTWNAKAGDESAISDFPSRHQAPALWYCCYIQWRIKNVQEEGS